MKFRYFYSKMAKLFANSGDPDQTSHSAVSELALHCLPRTLLGVSRLQWVFIVTGIIQEKLRNKSIILNSFSQREVSL